MKSEINKIAISFLFSLILFLYVLAGSFYSVDFLKPLVFVIFILLLFLNFILVFRALFQPNFMVGNVGVSLLLFSSFFFMLLSSGFNSSIELFMGGLNFFFCFLFFLLNYSGKKVYQIFEFPVKFLFLIFTLMNFSSGFSIPFQGIFSNPNSLGGLYSTVSIICAGIFIDKYRDINKDDWIILSLIILSVIFSLVSNSRISFVLSVLSLTVVLLFRYGDVFKIKGDKVLFNFKRLVLFIFVISIVALVVKFNYSYIEDIFLYKLFYKLDNDNFSAGRSEIWKIIWENKLVFGHGRDSPHLDNIGLAAHNTFMSILDQFGIISSLFFLFACLSMFLAYVRPYTIRTYGFLPLFIVLGFLLMSVSESMINKTIMFCLLALVNLKSFSPLSANK